MPYGNGQDAFGGALSGAAAGSAIMPGWGTVIGGAAGLAGGLLFGGKKTQGYSKGDLDYLAAQRYKQISDFSQQLSDSRARYLAQAQNLSSQSFGNYYGPSTITRMAAMGLNPSGGATQAELARQAMLAQEGINNNAFNAEQNDLTSVNNAYGQLSAAQMGGAFQNFGVPQNNPVMGAMGQLGSAGLNSMLTDRAIKSWQQQGGITPAASTPNLSPAMSFQGFGGRPGGYSMYNNPTGALGVPNFAYRPQ